MSARICSAIRQNIYKQKNQPVFRNRSEHRHKRLYRHGSSIGASYNNRAHFSFIGLEVGLVHRVRLCNDWDEVDTAAELAHNGDIDGSQAVGKWARRFPSVPPVQDETSQIIDCHIFFSKQINPTEIARPRNNEIALRYCICVCIPMTGSVHHVDACMNAIVLQLGEDSDSSCLLLKELVVLSLDIVYDRVMAETKLRKLG